MMSVTIVTERTVCVNGPSALSSETTPMADEGERAIATTAARLLAAVLVLSVLLLPPGGCTVAITARPSTNTTTSADAVRQTARLRTTW